MRVNREKIIRIPKYPFRTYDNIPSIKRNPKRPDNNPPPINSVFDLLLKIEPKRIIPSIPNIVKTRNTLKYARIL